MRYCVSEDMLIYFVSLSLSQRSLLENKNDEQDDVEAEDDGIDDEELNLILKRSDEEYTKFVEMDKEREKQEYDWWQAMGGRGTRPERLLQEYELPEVYRTEEPSDTLMEDYEFGRGQRMKEQIRYDDGLTERQWVRVIVQTIFFRLVLISVVY
jgi:ATP-dependent helicase STH1/SNF2